jgi:transcriptional/translational regulatory protein YebC/TACO1
MFDHKGVIRLEGTIDEDKLLEASLEGQAQSYEFFDSAEEGQGAEVFTEVSNLERLNKVLQAAGFKVKEAELRWIPTNTLEVSDRDQARFLLKLIDTLESLDDVQSVTANFDLVEELMLLDL